METINYGEYRRLLPSRAPVRFYETRPTLGLVVLKSHHMSPQALPRSYKRKYKKLHAQFVATQGSTMLLEEDIKDAIAIALKLMADNDMLLDLLGDLSPAPNSMVQQTGRSVSDSSAAGDLAVSHYDTPTKREVDPNTAVPEYFEHLPWDLDRNSFSGSYLEDLARTSTTTSGTNHANGSTETPATTSSSARKLAVRQQSSKKRERVEGDDALGMASGRKKKRKSIAVPNTATWDS